MNDSATLRSLITGPLSIAECDKLAEVAAATTATRALEVGHYLGLSTAVMLTSLPTSVEFVTIDHHLGDAWVPSVAVERFEENVAPFIGDRPYRNVNKDMREALTEVGDGFGFVFYDADHSAAGVADFWRIAVDILDDRCTLVFDDADWEDQSTLRTLAEADGFRVVTDIPFARLYGDKDNPDTYTLEVMQRG